MAETEGEAIDDDDGEEAFVIVVIDGCDVVDVDFVDVDVDVDVVAASIPFAVTCFKIVATMLNDYNSFQVLSFFPFFFSNLFVSGVWV